MRQLLLLRHAKSSWDDPNLSDHARPLNRRGRRAALAMKQAMEGLGLAPDLVLVSSSRRTLQTMEALEPWPGTPLIEPLDALYLATPLQIQKTLNDVADTLRSVLLIGHNPGLQEFAMMLVGAHAMASYFDADLQRLSQGYPSAALTEFAIPGPWRTLGDGSGRLVRFLCPRDLPETTA